MEKTAIITGITGQDGPYLAEYLLEKKYKVVGIVRSYNNDSISKLKELGIDQKVFLEECDLLDIPSIIKILNKYKPAELYNLSAQSSVGLSFEQPIGTIHFNIISVLNLLESIRIVDKKIRFYQASSSEMYGKVTHLPVTEETPMHPLSPYAISKASACWTVVNYRESYGLYSTNGILFNHESVLRANNFFMKKVIRDSVLISKGKKDVLKVGNIDIKRDFGYAPEYVKVMWLILQQDNPDDFIICSGRSISLRDIIYYVFDKLSIDRKKVVVDKELYRPTDIKDMYGDSSKAEKILKWNYNMKFERVLDILLEKELQSYNKPEAQTMR